MGLLEEIQRMRDMGMQENEIVSRLQEAGNSYRAISEAISQGKIKQAIEDPGPEQFPPVQNEMTPEEMNSQNMDQSILPPIQQEGQVEKTPNQEYFSEYNQNPSQEGYSQSPDYNQGALSSDTIMEISEQIVSEKLSDVRKKLEKMSSFKVELETKTEAIEERLKRIEKIIDTLQTSILRKVGDYVTNVEDIKHELIETQKTFAKALGSKHQEHKK